ncbi:PBP1A family penicillin-binding protein [Salipaludibacillus sp. CUR1]|uniref:transglycosylase domain-containing protein n=1 Tax=Salipaludibacillus sp. CUR1 TaxID=2820003 RepID=UPI001E41F8DF|nr:PBP1A family penicillin-binding protein [Salipaludibacillus sp. CUR1]MCE7793734.1 PBP1A family penicillin-binding protein [Salipaludibacillus sp. CUR1]
MWKRKMMLGIVFILSFFIIGFSVYAGIIIFGNYAIDEKELVFNESTTVVNQEGYEITKLFLENREVVDLEEVPQHVQDAFIAVEDHRFFQHTGIDFRAIGRALYRDIISRSKAEGGSTITQQLAKNAFLTHEKSWMRKTKEVLIAVNLERRYTKEEILEMYLNRIYFGHGAHGVEAASKLYFDKPVKELSIEEGALLAALPKAPNHYSPFLDPDRSKQRRDLVLDVMERRDFITAEEAVSLQGRTLPSDQTKITQNPAYLTYIDMVLLEAEEKYGISENELLKGGYKIVVAMDADAQQTTYDNFQKDDLFPASKDGQDVQGSVVLLDNKTGGVAAVQGGRDYVRKGFNRALAERSPGSAFKPVAVFAPAMEENLFNPFSLLKDEEMDFEGYSPRNINRSYAGEVTMFDAVKNSVNLPAVWALEQLGVETSKAYMEKQNILLEDEGLSIALGGLENGVTPVQLAASYRTFANEGKYSDPYFIEKIYSRNGDLIAENETEETEVISPQTAWYMTRMLESVVEEGTGSAGDYQGALAGKTGTTSFESVEGAARDLWFAGYSPDLTGAVWMGYDRTDADHYLTESSAVSVKAFKTILGEINDKRSDTAVAFQKPSGVEDLAEPIRLVDITDLSADFSVGFRGAQVDLEWSGSGDNRVHYRVYKRTGDGKTLIDEVVGETEYTVQGASLFSSSQYVVVPYNPQIDREGSESNVAEARFRLFSQDNAS